MSTTRRRRAAHERDSSQSPTEQPRLTKRQKNKATKEHYERLRARVASFIQDTVNPGLKDLAAEFNVPVADVRELAHLTVQATTKQRQLSLWQTVVSVESEASGGDMVAASKRASEKYSRLKQAVDAGDHDDEELAMYESKRKELEAEREPARVPSTSVKADRAVIADVTQRGKEIEDMLHTLRNMSGIEFCVFICPGNDRVSFPPHVYRSPKAAEFFKLKTKLDSVLFAQEMAGYTQHGAKVYELLAVQDPKHKTFVSELLTAQLRELTGNPRVKMQWLEMKELCAKYNIRLVGWPDDIELLPMSKTTIGKARRLHLLIRDGTLRFERASTAARHDSDIPLNLQPSALRAQPSHNQAQPGTGSGPSFAAVVRRPAVAPEQAAMRRNATPQGPSQLTQRPAQPLPSSSQPTHHTAVDIHPPSSPLANPSSVSSPNATSLGRSASHARLPHHFVPPQPGLTDSFVHPAPAQFGASRTAQPIYPANAVFTPPLPPMFSFPPPQFNTFIPASSPSYLPPSTPGPSRRIDNSIQ